MKIVATVRTLNEESNIRKFCESYSQFADSILIADGGSTDNTVLLASEYSKVDVDYFMDVVECDGGFFRNPDGPHIQFLIDWAVREGADWIVHQDCDQRPNKFLKEDIRDILATTTEPFVCVTQIFLWGRDKYFPKLSMEEYGFQQGLWAFRADIGLKIIDKMPHFEFSLDGKTSIDINKQPHKNLLPPYCFMHYGWETPEKTNAHVEYYRKSGLIKNMVHPLDYGGPLKPLQEWMIEV
jgi:hypothetical protein